MPDLTPKLGIKKPLGNENVSRQSFNENWDIIDAAAQKNIVQSGTAPASPAAGDLWLDTSVTPNVLKRYTGVSWVKVTPTTAAEIGLSNATQSVAGLMSGADKAKLDGLNAANYETPSGAQQKVNNAMTAHTSAPDPHPQYAMDTDLSAHTSAGTAHGATPNATPNTPILRDANGQANVGTPTAASHIARKQDVDAAATAASNAQAKADAALPASSYTAADVLAKIKTVDGAGSGLDADKLKGFDLAYGPVGNAIVLRESDGNIKATSYNNYIPVSKDGDVIAGDFVFENLKAIYGKKTDGSWLRIAVVNNDNTVRYGGPDNILKTYSGYDLWHTGTLRWNAAGYLEVNDGGTWKQSNSGSSLGASGYQKLASGLIIQWGSITINAYSDATATFPIAFPNACFSVQGTIHNPAQQPSALNTTTYGQTSVSFRNNTGGGITVNYLAIGN